MMSAFLGMLANKYSTGCYPEEGATDYFRGLCHSEHFGHTLSALNVWQRSKC